MVEVLLGTGALPEVTRRSAVLADRFERTGPASWDVLPDGRFVMLQSSGAAAHVDVIVHVDALVRARISIARRIGATTNP